MAKGSTKSALLQIRTLFELGTLGGLTDAQLLELFETRSGDDAEDASRRWCIGRGRWCSASAAGC
jgi:hypothetical protein